MTFMHRRTLAGLTALLVALVFYVAKANCPGCPPPGQPMNCMAACTAMLSIPNGNTTQFTTKGEGVFTITGGSQEERVSRFEPTKWTGTGSNAELGEVVWSFDVSQPVESSEVRSTGKEEFPATGDLYFRVSGTIGSLPNVVYQSVVALHLHADQLTSFAPFVNEDFKLVDPVDFEDAKNPGEVAFTLSDLTLHLE